MTDPRRTWAVVMAGGSGTRFWPASTAARPKQLTRLVGDETMLQATVGRVADFADEVLVITTAALVDATRAQLPELPPERVIGEPVGRDTAPCVALAAQIVEAADPGAAMLLLPADHLIEPLDRFVDSVRRAIEVADDGHLVTFGVEPRFAATGYGYLHAPDPLADDPGVRRVEAFVEKPDADTAAAHLAGGEHFWNSGIFAWRAEVVLSELDAHCPDLAATMEPTGQAWGSPEFDVALATAYGEVTPISIDYALMERAEKVAMVVADWTWDDLGSWDAVSDHLPADDRGNVVVGDALALDASGTLSCQLGGPPVVTLGVDDVIVVSTETAVLVLPKGKGQDVKAVVERLRSDGRDDLL